MDKIPVLDKHTRIILKNDHLSIFHDSTQLSSTKIEDSEKLKALINLKYGTDCDQLTNIFSKDGLNWVLLNLGKTHLTLFAILKGPEIVYEHPSKKPVGYQYVLTDDTIQTFIFKDIFKDVE